MPVRRDPGASRGRERRSAFAGRGRNPAGAARAGTALGMANTSVFLVCFLTPFSIPHLMAARGWPLVWLAAAGCALVAVPLLAPRAPSTSAGACQAPKSAKTALSRST